MLIWFIGILPMLSTVAGYKKSKLHTVRLYPQECIFHYTLGIFGIYHPWWCECRVRFLLNAFSIYMIKFDKCFEVSRKMMTKSSSFFNSDFSYFCKMAYNFKSSYNSNSSKRI